jgi:hypothetical protein
MTDLLGYAPIAATAFGVPQFLPQIFKLRATDDTTGLSWSWLALTTLNNAGWFGYFFLARYWTALLASASVTLLAGTLTMTLTRRRRVRPLQLALVGCWAATLAAAYDLAAGSGLGTLLAAAFAVQVAPSLWTAYRTAHPTGVSAGTWALILGELACFLVFGLHESDPRLTALGVTGVMASMLMLGRIYWTGRRASWPPTSSGSGQDTTR